MKIQKANEIKNHGFKKKSAIKLNNINIEKYVFILLLQG